MKANVTCLSCLLNQKEKSLRAFTDEDRKMACLREIMACFCQKGADHSAPYLHREAETIVAKYFPAPVDWPAVKSRYNQYMLTKEKLVEQRIRQSGDVLAACIQYVCAANYIDFSAVANVDDAILDKLLDKAAAEMPDPQELRCFREELETAKNLVYLTDNCGEIVLDKIFIKFLREMYPSLQLTVMVRGGLAVNDATMEDALQVGLPDIAPCLGSGSNIPATVPGELSPEAEKLLREADVIISKGQGNFESLYGEGLNPYFMFLCKCELFVRRFGLQQFASVFAREDRIKMIF